MRTAILTAGVFIAAAIRPDLQLPRPLTVFGLVLFGLFGIMDGYDFAVRSKSK